MTAGEQTISQQEAGRQATMCSCNATQQPVRQLAGPAQCTECVPPGPSPFPRQLTMLFLQDSAFDQGRGDNPHTLPGVQLAAGQLGH